MLYNIVMTVLLVVSAVGAIWSTVKINKAAREGRIRYVGKVRTNERNKDND